MKRLPNATLRIALALLVGVVAAPGATTAFLRYDAGTRSAIRAERRATPAEEKSVTWDATKTLSEADKRLLMRYVRAHMCPLTLKGYPVPGFYHLCLALVGEDALDQPVVGLLNHTAYIKRTVRGAVSTLPKFKLRQQVMKDSVGMKRSPGAVPGRPTPYIQPVNP